MKFLKNIAKAGIKKRKRKLSEEELILGTTAGLAAAGSATMAKIQSDRNKTGETGQLAPGNSNSRRARQEGK
jgi:hypothetical protein